jgi:hypothetical protein
MAALPEAGATLADTDCSSLIEMTSEQFADAIIASYEAGDSYDYIVVERRESFDYEGRVCTHVIEAALWGGEVVLCAEDGLERALWQAWGEGRREFLKHVGYGRWACPVLGIGLTLEDVERVNRSLASLGAKP